MTQAPPLTLGEHLRRARKQSGKSQAALAIAVGVSRPTIGNWERDDGEPTMRQFVRLTAATGAEWLIDVARDLSDLDDRNSSWDSDTPDPSTTIGEQVVAAA